MADSRAKNDASSAESHARRVRLSPTASEDVKNLAKAVEELAQAVQHLARYVD